MSGWKGIIVSESLSEPSIISEFEVFKATISKKELDLGEGNKGRWHLYHVYATDSQLDALQTMIKRGWYAHFWRGKDLVVIFKGRRFEMRADDKSSWKDAIEYGLSVGIPEKELDFPTE